GPALSSLEGGISPFENRQFRQRAGAGILPGAEPACRDHAACRQYPRRQWPPYRGNLFQGGRAGAANGVGARFADGGRHSFNQRPVGRVKAMATYVAMEPASGPAAVRTQLVPDRFVFVAFLAPVLWLLWHRLWLEAFVVLAVSFALGSLSMVPGQEGLAVVLGLLVALLIALEGGALRIAALRRRGW